MIHILLGYVKRISCEQCNMSILGLHFQSQYFVCAELTSILSYYTSDSFGWQSSFRSNSQCELYRFHWKSATFRSWISRTLKVRLLFVLNFLHLKWDSCLYNICHNFVWKALILNHFHLVLLFSSYPWFGEVVIFANSMKICIYNNI